MNLDWSHWGYDFFKELLRSVGVSGSAWLGMEVKYQEINLEDLGWCVLVGGVVRTLLHFLETRPLPEDLDAVKPIK